MKTLMMLVIVNLLLTVNSFAELYTETAEASGGSNESIDVIADRALVVAKRQALERSGTVVQSDTVVKNFMLESDEIKSFAAGITKVIKIVSKDVKLDSQKNVITVTLIVDLDVDSGKVQEYAKALLEQKQEKNNDPIEFTIQMLKRKKNTDGTYQYSIIPPTMPLVNGDEFRIQFKSSKDVFVYIINEDQKGEIGLIFPHTNANTKIKANFDQILPDEENVFFVEGEKGTEKLYIIASTTEMKDIEILLNTLQDGANVKELLKKNIQQRKISVTTSGQLNKKVTEVVQGKGAIMKVFTIDHQ